MSCIRCGGALVDSGIFCPKCRADEDAKVGELDQLRERNERFSTVAHQASHELEALQRKYQLLERDRNALLQLLRERDARIAMLRGQQDACIACSKRRKGKTNDRPADQA